MSLLIDTFLYAGELDLLDIRLRELEGLADRVVAIAGAHTLRGEMLDIESTFDFAEAWPQLSIIRPVVEDAVPLEREANLRAWADRLASSGAMVLHGDVDEIPRRSDVEEAIATYRTPIRLRGNLHQLRLDWRLTPRDGQPHPDAGVHPFAGPVLAAGDAMAQIGALKLRQDTSLPEMHSSGWHLQWVMTPAECVRKVRSFGHPEFAVDPFTDESFWQRCAREGRDPLDRWMLHACDIDESFPLAVVAEPQRWRHLLREAA